MWKQMSCADSETVRLWKLADNERNTRGHARLQVLCAVCGFDICTRLERANKPIWTVALPHVTAGVHVIRTTLSSLPFDLSASLPVHHLKTFLDFSSSVVDLCCLAPSPVVVPLLAYTKSGYYLSLRWTWASQCTGRLTGTTTRREASNYMWGCSRWFCRCIAVELDGIGFSGIEIGVDSILSLWSPSWFDHCYKSYFKLLNCDNDWSKQGSTA